MKENENIPLRDDRAEGLLKAYLLSASTDRDLIKNTIMDMTAEIVFGTKAFYEPSKPKEREMLDKLSESFGDTGHLGKTITGIFGILLVSCMLLYYFNSHRNTVIPLRRSAGRNYTVDTDKKELEVSQRRDAAFKSKKKYYTKRQSAFADTTNADAKSDSALHHIPGTGASVKPIQSAGSPDNIQPSSLAASYRYPDDFKTLWKPTLEKYELKTGDFTLSPFLEHFIVQKTAVIHNYYLGMPFRKTPDDLIYINYGEQIAKAEKADDKTVRIPLGARFYIDTQATAITHGLYKIPEVPDKVLSRMLEPFYFRRYEVTNAEYQEFLRWVAENNGVTVYDRLHMTSVNIEGTFSYTFSDPNSPALKGLKRKTINVFPDTLVFLKDFPFAKDDIMPKTYFSNPEYDEEPICGINYWQALAYLDWMTKRCQNYLDAAKVPYKISFELPTDVEWEAAASLLTFNQKAPLIGYNAIFDNNWISSLVLTAKDSERNKSLDGLLNHDVIYWGNYVEDGFFYPGPADLRSRKLRLNAKGALHLDDFGISWMDDNVSEWMQENYKDNWLPMYRKHNNLLRQSGKEEDELSAMIEDYFNKRNAENGQLVRGGNFWDERFSEIQKKNLAGVMLKRFVSPDEAHATIGFRYVVRVVKR